MAIRVDKILISRSGTGFEVEIFYGASAYIASFINQNEAARFIKNIDFEPEDGIHNWIETESKIKKSRKK